MALSDELLDNYGTVANTPNLVDYNYPLQFEFKIGTLANDFITRDTSGKTLLYVRQKMFKFKEAIQIYSSEDRAELKYTIAADRIIDFNASYALADDEGNVLGHIGRRGMKSLLKAHYEVYDNNKNPEFLVQEENPWAKFWDALLCEVPLLGLLSGYLFNPRYIVKRADTQEIVLRLSKEKSFWGRRFKLDKLANLEQGQNERVVLGLMMMTLLERRRG